MAIKYKSDHASAYNNLGIILNEQGKYDEAIKQYQMAIKYKPDLANAYNNLGLVLKNQGKYD